MNTEDFKQTMQKLLKALTKKLTSKTKNTEMINHFHFYIRNCSYSNVPERHNELVSMIKQLCKQDALSGCRTNTFL